MRDVSRTLALVAAALVAAWVIAHGGAGPQAAGAAAAIPAGSSAVERVICPQRVYQQTVDGFGRTVSCDGTLPPQTYIIEATPGPTPRGR